jgi:predicted transcriptional regulator
MANPKNKPTESELEILQILWEKGPSTVRDIHEIISETKEVGYTTTLKLMQIMAEKNIVDRDTNQRTHIYTATVAKEKTQSALLESFKEAAFGGSTMNLVMQALGNYKANKEEIAEIRALIDKIEKQ